MSAIQGLYIFDEHNNLLFNHVYFGHPASPTTVLPLYLRQSSHRPSVVYLPSLSPPAVLYSILQDNLLFIAPSSTDIEPLLAIEFLHRVADALEEFVGSPLLASKLTANYDIAAQVVAEMADAGVVCQGEANALRDVVETGPGVLKNLLGGVGLPGASPGLGSGGPSIGRLSLQPAQSSQGSAIPWRRSNVRHTSNELYVDLVESLIVTLAPSGRPLSAFANGSIAFTSKVSGVPDLLLNLTTDGKGAGMGSKGEKLRNVMERVVFHPCVRLSPWKSDGVLSFVPPDGKFILCAYETDLLGPDTNFSTSANSPQALDLPASLEVKTNLGATGTEFEVRVIPSNKGAAIGRSAATASLQSHLDPSRAGALRVGSGDSKSPALETLSVHIPIPPAVRNVSELRPSRGEAQWLPADSVVDWRIPTKDFGSGGASLRCGVQGPLVDDVEDVGGVVNGMTALTYDYDEDQPPEHKAERDETSTGNGSVNGTDSSRASSRNHELMPTSASLSFSVKGWLASGLKVESLLVDTNKSRGLGAEVKPYKGVKYLTVSRRGVEVRC